MVMVSSLEIDTIFAVDACTELFASYVTKLLSMGKLLVKYHFRFAKIKVTKLVKISMLHTVKHYYSTLGHTTSILLPTALLSLFLQDKHFLTILSN